LEDKNKQHLFQTLPPLKKYKLCIVQIKRLQVPKHHVIKTIVQIHTPGKIHGQYLRLNTQNVKGRDIGRKRKGVGNELNTPKKLQSTYVP
jgi:hypothetical protein